MVLADSKWDIFNLSFLKIGLYVSMETSIRNSENIRHIKVPITLEYEGILCFANVTAI